MTAGLRILLCLLPAVAAGALRTARAGETILQYGFDFTSGSVQSNGGGLILNDCGPDFPSFPTRGNGGTYTPDIPPRVRFATGTGSVSLATGAFSTNFSGAGSGVRPVHFTEILQWQGVTVEFWMKGGPAKGVVLTLSGSYEFSAKPGGLRWGNGLNSNEVTGSLTNQDWHHAAGILARPRAVGTALEADLILYIDGVLQGTYPGSSWPHNLSRGLAAGNHPMLNVDTPWTGKIYEPRISAGVLTPEEFMCYPSAAAPPASASAAPPVAAAEPAKHDALAVTIAWITSAFAVLCAVVAALALRSRRRAIRSLQRRS